MLAATGWNLKKMMEKLKQELLHYYYFLYSVVLSLSKASQVRWLYVDHLVRRLASRL